MTDNLAKFRKKSRFVFELRFNPIIETFDSRGKTLTALKKEFDKQLEHWRVENVAVKLLDDPENPTRSISFEHIRIGITFEDISIKEYLEHLEKVIVIHSSLFKYESIDFGRIGLRNFGIFTANGLKSFENINNLIVKNYVNKLNNLSIVPNDILIRISHPEGEIGFGPVKKDEDWIQQHFKQADKNVPQFGIGIDVDSYTIKLKANTKEEVQEAAKTLLSLNIALEQEILSPILT